MVINQGHALYYICIYDALDAWRKQLTWVRDGDRVQRIMALPTSISSIRSPKYILLAVWEITHSNVRAILIFDF